MKTRIVVLISFFLVSSSFASAQKGRPKPKATPQNIILAVLRDGKLVEPIAVVEKGKLAAPEIGDGASKAAKAFSALYYKPATTYPLIFGGAPDGKIEILKSNVGGECAGNSADAASKPIKANIKGMVMALATNMKTSRASGVRRRPTPDERSEIEALVRAEFTKKGIAAVSVKNLRYHNLTALDIDRDGKAEFIGSFWVEPKSDERDLLFFIAEQNTSGKYSFTYSDFSTAKPEDVMSGDIKDLDTGIGSELLLDVLDVDNDGVDEIFTIGQAFEGNNYYVHKRVAGKWTRVYEAYNYRCAF